jgi:hypothetical protein
MSEVLAYTICASFFFEYATFRVKEMRFVARCIVVV